ncbi:MAG: BamA/TamA family outer membrane protein [Trueperaceae bacterium]|nr:BamA/TamA family outer membrane protein [Trueperaceae bacterium]
MWSPRLLLLLALSLPGAVLAQGPLPTAQGPLLEVRVEGTTTFTDIVRTIVAARAGTQAERVDLEAERNRVYALGTFEEVSVTLEDRGAGPVLIVRVRENPPVAAVEVVGTTLLEGGALRDAIVAEHLLDPGRTLNALRAERAIGTLQGIYRSVGVPYDVDVTLEVLQEPAAAEPGGRTPVRLRYLVEESVPLRRVVFEDSSLLSEAELEQLFARVAGQDTFGFGLYRQAVDAVAERYWAAGLRQSGIDLERSTLENGELTVRFRELRIAAFDTVALGVPASRLSLAVGDLFNYDVLLEDIRRLARGRSSDVRIETLATSTGAVRVRFALGAPDTAGPVREVVIEGNTVLDDALLTDLLALGVGDTFTSALADEDFRRLRAAYDEVGVVIDARPSYNYLDGTYVQRVTELRIAGYAVVYDGAPGRTEERVVTRYLPAVGEIVDLNRLDDGLRRLARLGIVTPVNRLLVPAEEPGEVTVEVVLRANTTGLLQPGAQYSTETGFSASVSYAESNLWGLAHNLSAEVQALTSDLGLQFGGSVRYAVPWLDVPVLDLQEVPTSLTVSLFSRVDVNQPLTVDGRIEVPYPGLPDREGTRVPAGEYLVRSSGASFSVGRRVLPNTDLVVAARGAYDVYRLEPPREACEFDDDGDVVNAPRCALPEDVAVTLLPAGGLSAFTSATLTYDDRDSEAFPREGVAASVSFGVGWGSDQRDPITGDPAPYVYQQVQAGVKSYLALADVLPDVENRNHVLAVRLNVGHQFGDGYPANRRFRVGRVPVEATELRGYVDTDFDLSRSYVTSSVEYRYDFGLSTVATETIIGIVFADVGYVPEGTGAALSGASLYGSVGAGVQVNLGFGGVSLPALRFDYGFSARNPSGVFSFRVGPVF